MVLARDLLSQARFLVRKERTRPKQASLRRAISTAYYAVFHLLVDEVSRHLTRGDSKVSPILARALQHSDMRAAARSFGGGNLKEWIARSLGTTRAPSEIEIVAKNFVALQGARHSADYDLSHRFSRQEARDFVDLAAEAFEVWKRFGKKCQEKGATGEEARSMRSAFLVCLLTYRRLESR